MPPMEPLVSAVIPTYNRTDRLVRAVESVLNQTYDNIELLVVDDHSERPATDVLADLPTDRVAAFRCIRHDENQGGGGARNTGIEAATGKFVAFLDDDDRWHEEKITRQVEALSRADEGVGVIYTGRTEMGESVRTDVIPSPMSEDATRSLLCENVVGSTSVVMVRAECIDRAGPFDERFPSWQELEWYVRLSRHCDFKLVPRALVYYDTTGDDRITDDFDKIRGGYDLFVEKHEPLAAEYGPLFRRKMLGWAAFRAGENAIANGRLWEGRSYVFKAMRHFPFELKFLGYFLAVLGGPVTYRLAVGVRDFLATK